MTHTFNFDINFYILILKRYNETSLNNVLNDVISKVNFFNETNINFNINYIYLKNQNKCDEKYNFYKKNA